jgi:cytochrome c55X
MTKISGAKAPISAALLLLGAACAAHAENSSPVDSAMQQVALGRALYSQHCSHCHGFNMVKSSPVAFDLREFPKYDKARFVNSVTRGKNNQMPPWGDVLKPEEIDQLWAYVQTGGQQ